MKKYALILGNILLAIALATPSAANHVPPAEKLEGASLRQALESKSSNCGMYPGTIELECYVFNPEVERVTTIVDMKWALKSLIVHLGRGTASDSLDSQPEPFPSLQKRAAKLGVPLFIKRENRSKMVWTAHFKYISEK